MRRNVSPRALVVCLLFTFLVPNASAAIKAGANCTKAGIKSVSAGKTYTCVKSGKKLVWNKGVMIPVAKPAPNASASAKASVAPAASPSPMAVQIPSAIPTSFENLYQNRTAIAYAAWFKTGETMKVSEAKIPTVKTFIGPNTKPWYSDVEKALGLVSKAFPTAKLPANALVFYYNFSDVLWAEDTLKTLISAQTYTNLNRNEGGHLVDSNCQAQFKDCLGAKEVTTYDGLDIAILLIGVSNNPGMATVGGGTYGDPGTLENNTTGQLLAHEYFHALQREEQIGKNLLQSDWPPRWVTEGSAYFIQNAVINSGDFGKYSNWRKIAVGNYIKEKGITEEFVTDFMNLSHYSDNWSTFEGDWNYFLGSRIIETLVALKGPGSIIDFYKLMGQGKGFEYSFDNVFGIAYKDAVPIIAKTVADNWKTKS